eukprot:TRINITY_DN2941_c0_g1_i1.p1 TRINITY_DN2941_c0_g1~~TRINITY_DN2941_c0_g1_i1.p1  ORF type:complete len:484 (+),score=169.90 TRINITY_DN2941_c0_g1_i1:148-1599(+)
MDVSFDERFSSILYEYAQELRLLKAEGMLVSLLEDLQSPLPEGMKLCDLVKETVEAPVEDTNDSTSLVEEEENEPENTAVHEKEQKEETAALEEKTPEQANIQSIVEIAERIVNHPMTNLIFNEGVEIRELLWDAETDDEWTEHVSPFSPLIEFLKKKASKDDIDDKEEKNKENEESEENEAEGEHEEEGEKDGGEGSSHTEAETPQDGHRADVGVDQSPENANTKYNRAAEWQLKRNVKGIETYYRSEDGSPTQSLKVCMTMNADIFTILVCLNELELYDGWIPFLKKGDLLGQLSEARVMCYFCVGLPWPLQARDVQLYGYAVDALDMDRVLIFARSHDETDDWEFSSSAFEATRKPAPELKKNVVRMVMHRAGFIVRPIDEHHTKVTWVVNTDPKLALIPYWFLNFMVRSIAHTMFERLHKIVVNFKGSVYEERIEQKQFIYSMLRRKCDTYFGRIPETSSSLKDGDEESSGEEIQPLMS